MKNDDYETGESNIMTKLLVADNSALMRRLMCDIINAEPNFHVEAISSDGLDAYNKIKEQQVDIVVLDMDTPKLSGYEVLAKLAEDKIKMPVILISSAIKEDAENTMAALSHGAVDVVVKPLRSTSESREEFKGKLMHSIKAVSKSLVKPGASQPVDNTTASSKLADMDSLLHVQYKPVEQPELSKSAADALAKATKEAYARRQQSNKITKVSHPPQVIPGKRIIALACSTGGPQALHKFIPMLPADLPVPVVLVQHMPEGFTASLASRLDSISSIRVKEAEEGEIFKPGTVYITPGGRHMEIKEDVGNHAYAHLSDAPPIGNLRPCADVMYTSLAETSFEEIICVVLTGMGADGTEGIDYLSGYRNIYCISQSADTCVVYGMPKAVEQRGLSNEVVPLTEIANSITKKLGV